VFYLDNANLELICSAIPEAVGMQEHARIMERQADPITGLVA